MTRQIRRLGVAMLVLYGVLFVQLNVVQVVRAGTYNDNPTNTRAVTRDFGRPRGRILSADGAVLAQSVEDGSNFKRHRVYPEHDLFGQITGYFSFTYGSDGVEKTYNDELTGRKGAASVDHLVDLLVDKEHTNDLVLTIDKRVQQVARDQLRGRAGSVVAIDPRDGSIIAMYGFPSFDPEPVSQTDQKQAGNAMTALQQAPGKPLLPRPFRERFFPGSTFKVVTSAAGLRSGKVTPQQPVYPTETQFVPPHTTKPIRNFGGERCGGPFVDILRVSCNSAFARMGLDVGADDLVATAHDFGFSDTPPLDLPRPVPAKIEDASFFQRNEAVLAQTAIGQNAVSATPLQMALVAAGIANGGQVMVPHVLKEIRDDEDRVVRRGPKRVWKTAVDPAVAATLRDAMVEVVEHGTATRLKPNGVPTAGKTGTAQIGNGTSHTWIIGFAPADAPRVAIAVIVEAQPGASEFTGGRIAAPIGQAVLEAALNAVPAGP